MRYSSLLLAAGLAASARAADETTISRPSGCLLDNCLRALKATQRPGLPDCISYSSAILAATPVTVIETAVIATEVVTTITAAAAPPDKRDGEGLFRRDASLPEYALSQCKGDVSRYWSACSCLMRYSIGVTTVSIPPVTVTQTTSITAPATATAVSPGDSFKIFYEDSTGAPQYLYRPATEEGVKFSEAEFSALSGQAGEFLVLSERQISDAATGAILACDNTGNLAGLEFLCGFYAPDTNFTLEAVEPLSCARHGTDELRCSITGKNFPIWAKIDGRLLFGILENSGQLEELPPGAVTEAGGANLRLSPL